MPSAVFLAWASFIFAWPLAAASLAISVAAVACALTLSSSPIGRLPFLASSPIMRRPGAACNRNGPPQVLGAAETRVVEVVLVVFFGSVLAGTEVDVVEAVVDAC